LNKLAKTELFRQLFHTHYENLHRYAYTFLKDSQNANDIVQSVFTRLWEKRDTVTFDEDIKGYLYTAVHNRCLNNIRNERTKARYMEYKKTDAGSFIQDGTAYKVLVTELSKRIAQATAALPEQCRIIFLKSREEGKKYAEIAAELGISVKTVETQMSKALRILREKLADYLVLLLLLLHINHPF
jgi:RNA polymerase sigma-70 factor (ECF subfamily)